jgi:hypothetical protein
MSRIFPSGSYAKKRVATDSSKTLKSSVKKHVGYASSKTLKEWKNDSKLTKTSLSESGNPNQRVTLKGHALASLLGSVACRENNLKWSDNHNNRTSIAGSVCTEFGMLSTPESFAACMNPVSFGHTTRAKAANSDVSGLGSIHHNRDTMVVTNSSISRKATIMSMSTLNKQLASEFTPDEFELSNVSEENDVTFSPCQLSDGRD